MPRLLCRITMSTERFERVGNARVLTTQEMAMRSALKYSIWNEKDDYCFTLRLTEGRLRLQDEIWAEITDLVTESEKKRIAGSKIYLGAVDKINVGYDDMRNEYTKPEEDGEANEALTVNVVFESFKRPHYPLSVIFEKWQCVNLIIYHAD